MLQTLKIQNVALIKQLEIDFEKGFNVLLGETGAGKSIIFDALNFVLGGKADKSLIRSGESVMKVEALFSCVNPLIFKDLEEFDEPCEELVLSRSLDSLGKSSIRINGGIFSLQSLKRVGEALVDSYSQHEGMQLLKSKNHLAMLDKLGGEGLKHIKNKYLIEYERLIELNKKIKSLGGDEFERARTKSLLSYQIKEIEDANIQLGEMDELKNNIMLLESAEKIYDTVNSCENLLESSNMSAIAAVHDSTIQLSALTNISEIEECRNRLNSVKYELQDISETLKALRDNLTFDEGELDRLVRRQDSLKLLCKKYGGSEEKVLAFLLNIKTQFEELENSEERLAQLEKEKLKLEKSIQAVANELSQARKEIAAKVEVDIERELAQLNMKSTTFKVQFAQTDFALQGQDEVEFVFSANKGQELKALSKTASGGEMSRVMLAFKTIFAHAGNAETLIFDEIDTGISGETGYIVGEKLSALGRDGQVLCITHLPQVASQGDNFYFVAKTSDAHSTFTSIEKLETGRITEELARLIAGDKLTETAKNQVQELRARAGK